MVQNLITVFERLKKYNLKVQLSKSKLFEKELKVLGVIFSQNGKRVDPARIEAIDRFPPIKTLKDCQRFLGMLAYICGFIPHYSTMLYPIFACLRNQKTQKFELTLEAKNAIMAVKECIKQQTMLYNIDFKSPLYLCTDASNFCIGALLYQVEIFDKSPEGEQQMLQKFGFLPEKGQEVNMLPGISPGRNTPIASNFTRDPGDVTKYDVTGTLTSSLSMTEKIEKLENKVILVKPISWYSKTFSMAQVKKYASMEKEFLGLVLSVNNYKDYIESCPMTYVLTDSQPVLWAIKHKDSCIKLTRLLLKLFELNISFACVHLAGERNVVADYLSRLIGSY